MRPTFQVLCSAIAFLAMSVWAHQSGTKPYHGYSGPDIERACEEFTIDDNGTLEASCHAPVIVAGVPYDQDDGEVEHYSAELELGDKIQFASGSLSRGGDGDFDSVCANLSVSSSATAVTVSADCDEDLEDDDPSVTVSLDLSSDIVIHDGNGDFDWFPELLTN